MNKYSIIYIGTPHHFQLSSEELLKKINCKLTAIPYDIDQFDTLLESLIEKVPSIILIEVNSVDNELLNFLLLLKSHSKLSKCRIIALFSDKAGLNKYCDIYSFGVDYGFIASEEKERMLNDLEQILSPRDSNPLQYAKADNLLIPARITFLSKVSHITHNSISIESSLNLKIGDIIKADLNLDENIRLSYFKVKNLNTFMPRSYFSSTADLEILFDHIEGIQFKSDQKSTTEEEFKKFLVDNNQSFFSRNDPALILDHRIETLASLVGELNVNNRFIKVANSFEKFEESFSVFKPNIICYQMQEESEDMADDDRLRIHGTKTFNKLMVQIKSIPRYNPFVLVFNQRSRSRAYRKAHHYDNIIVNRKNFELDYLSMIMDGFQEQYPEQKEISFLKPPENNTLIELCSDITVTSISENIITFLFADKLHPYTTFKISAPLNIYVTVIPNSMGETSENQEYLGIISNTNEEDKMKLRKLVNILIKAELEESEVLALKSVEELQEDVVNSKLEELKALRKSQKEQYQNKIKEESED